jgi:hypothetical protein
LASKTSRALQPTGSDFLGSLSSAGRLCKSSKEFFPKNYFPTDLNPSKKHFSEKKIPADWRQKLPVLCDKEGAILWVPHLPPTDFVKVQKNFALKITFSST